MSTSDHVWFPEPTTPDPSIGRRGESTLAFLNRSTWTRAQAMRAFLNSQLSYLPKNAQASLVTKLKTQWQSAFFELIVARALQTFGAELEFELELPSGSRPDFFAEFDGVRTIIEAVSPAYHSEMASSMERHRDLLMLVENDIPEGWLVGIAELPDITQNMSKKPFRKVLLELFDTLENTSLAEFDLDRETDAGFLRIFCVRTTGKGGIFHEPFYTFWSDAEETIRTAYSKKRKQVRGSELPVLLAIEGPPVSHDLTDFDIALFGRTSGLPLDSYRPSDKMSGVFELWKTSPPSIDAVLVFFAPGWTGCADPVLYLNPRSSKTLPAQLERLHRRVLSADRTRIISLAAIEDNLLNNGISFVSTEA